MHSCSIQPSTLCPYPFRHLIFFDMHGQLAFQISPPYPGNLRQLTSMAGLAESSLTLYRTRSLSLTVCPARGSGKSYCQGRICQGHIAKRRSGRVLGVRRCTCAALATSMPGILGRIRGRGNTLTSFFFRHGQGREGWARLR